MQRLLLVWQDLEVREKATIASGIQCSNRRTQPKTEHDSSVAVGSGKCSHGPSAYDGKDWRSFQQQNGTRRAARGKRSHVRQQATVAALAIAALRQKSFD